MALNDNITFFPFNQGVSHEQYQSLQKRFDEVTDLLCKVMTVVQPQLVDNTTRNSTRTLEAISKIEGLSEWWADYQKWDNLRKVAEKEAAEREVERASEVLKTAKEKLKNLK